MRVAPQHGQPMLGGWVLTTGGAPPGPGKLRQTGVPASYWWVRPLSIGPYADGMSPFAIPSVSAPGNTQTPVQRFSPGGTMGQP